MAIKTPDWWYRRKAQGAPWWRPALWYRALLCIHLFGNLILRIHRIHLFCFFHTFFKAIYAFSYS